LDSRLPKAGIEKDVGTSETLMSKIKQIGFIRKPLEPSSSNTI